VSTCLIKALGSGSTRSKNVAKVLYFVLMVFTAVLAVVARYWVPDARESLKSWPGIQITRDCDEACFRNHAAYRVAFSASCLFVIMFLTSLIGGTFATKSHRSMFVLKFVFIPLMSFAMLWVPNYFFEGYAWLSLFVALLFIIAQWMALIDFAYSWNESWVSKAEEDDNRNWLIAVVVCSVILLVGSWTGTIVMYVHYNDPLSHGLLSLSLIGGIALLVLSITDFCGHGAMLTSSVVVANVTFMTWFALMSSPIHRQEADSVAKLFFGLIIAAIALGWTSSSLANSPDIFHVEKREAVEHERVSAVATQPKPGEATSAMEEGETAAGNASSSSDDAPPDTYRDEQASPADVLGIRWFHFMMLTATFYLCMVGSNWMSTDTREINTGWTQFWVQMAGVWLVLLMYLWTLVAPKLLPGREF